MTTIVSFTDFRDNLSNNLDLLKKGNKVTIKNAKNGKDMVTLVAEKEAEFDWDEYMEFIRNFKPIFTDKDVKRIKDLRKKSKDRLRRLNW